LATLERDGGEWVYDEGSGRLYHGEDEITVDLFNDVNQSQVPVFHTIFKDDLRVLTNIKKEDGTYAVGTTADPEIFKQVKSGETFTKNGVKILGQSYTVCYEPIYNGTEFWGMMFTGVSQSMVISEAMRLILAIAISMAVALIAIVIISGRLLKRLSDRLIKEIDGSRGQLIDFSDSIQEISGKTAVETADITTAMNSVAAGATAQAAATQEAMTATEDFTRSLDAVNEQIRESGEYLKKINNYALDSEDAMVQLNKKLEDNNAIVESISRDIEEGVKNTMNAKSIVKTIDNLAFQINLLALNASVEAAHAGELGLGFAVVAEEIKNLAANSARSAAETADIIGEIVDTMQKTKDSNDALVAGNDEQIKKAEVVVEKMDAMKAGVREIEEKLDNISEKSASIQVVKGELVKVVQSLSSTAQENAAVSEEVCASAETVGADVDKLSKRLSEINDICNKMEEVVDFYGRE
ncbi:MAG: cache domain-containing protein, partial [Lachnospiraceae bacterium]|nr:cache domain-containing protein [Lachnospiraceae bacterium]